MAAVQKASLLVYDIPERCSFPNPSPRLRRIGVRVNLSCWVVPDDRIPWALLNQMELECAPYMTDGRRPWEVIPFDPSGADKIAGIAARALKREMLAAVNVARKADRKATEKAEAGPDGRIAYWQRVRSALSRSRRLLKDAKMASETFGLDPNSFDFSSGFESINAIGASARARAHLYGEMQKALVSIGEPSMAESVANDDVYAGVAADMLEEVGHPLAESVRDVIRGDLV